MVADRSYLKLKAMDSIKRLPFSHFLSLQSPPSSQRTLWLAAAGHDD